MSSGWSQQHLPSLLKAPELCRAVTEFLSHWCCVSLLAVVMEAHQEVSVHQPSSFIPHWWLLMTSGMNLHMVHFPNKTFPHILYKLRLKFQNDAVENALLWSRNVSNSAIISGRGPLQSEAGWRISPLEPWFMNEFMGGYRSCSVIDFLDQYCTRSNTFNVTKAPNFFTEAQQTLQNGFEKNIEWAASSFIVINRG